MDEAEAVRVEMSRLTKAPFEIEEPKQNRSFDTREVRWFVNCPVAEFHEQVAHAHSVWADSRGDLWIESSILGFVSEWIEQDYNEQAGIRFDRMKPHDFSNPQFRQQVAKEFPTTMRRFEKYESKASEVSSRRKVQLHVRYDNSISSITITMGAKIEVKGMDLKSKLKAIEINVRALKEAYQEIMDL